MTLLVLVLWVCKNDSEWDRKEDKGGFHVLVVTHLATYIFGI